MLKELEIRRSLRRFTNEPVSDQQLEQLLRAAMQAPSARNQQPWEFVVVKNQETFAKIQEIWWEEIIIGGPHISWQYFSMDSTMLAP